MERKPGIEPSKGGCSILVEGSKKVAVGRLYSQTFQPMAPKFIDPILSEPMILYTDSGIDYNYVSVQLSFLNVMDEYNSVKVLFNVGNAEFVVYSMIFRVLFSLSMLVFLILLLLRLRSSKTSSWHLEQKITISLLFSLALYNNPFLWI
uniref:Wnt-binding factor n=1 Tax=Coptotermes formosanus TaxID=36987 RepID=R4UKY6_COPFO|nr:Wnt-binding factor [Coptotermes formosanus]